MLVPLNESWDRVRSLLWTEGAVHSAASPSRRESRVLPGRAALQVGAGRGEVLVST